MLNFGEFVVRYFGRLSRWKAFEIRLCGTALCFGPSDIPLCGIPYYPCRGLLRTWNNTL